MEETVGYHLLTCTPALPEVFSWLLCHTCRLLLDYLARRFSAARLYAC